MPDRAAMESRVAVLGAGAGGLATAGHLIERGHTVALYDLPEFAPQLAPVRAHGIRIYGAVSDNVYRPSVVTTDVEEALDGVRVVLVIVPAYGHARFAQALVPHLRDHHVVLMSPGAFGGALEFYSTSQRIAPRYDPVIGESANLIYTAHRMPADDAEAPANVRINGIKRAVPAAAIPAERTGEMLAALAPVYPEFSAAGNVLETGLNNVNIIVHPVLVTGNLSLTERGVEWGLFRSGLTPSIARLMDAVDAERLAILRALDLPALSLAESMIRYYADQGVRGDDLYEVLSTAPVLANSKGARSFQHRHVREDVPYGLVPMAAVAAAIGVPTPCTDAVITVLSAAVGEDFRNTGRGIRQLGLEGMGAAEILRAVTEGVRA